MFKGKAVLKNPETGQVVGTFTENSHSSGETHAEVVLDAPVTLDGTARLEIHTNTFDNAVISIAASDPAGTTIHKFGGISTLGRLPDKAPVSLVRTPGGKLGTLLVVLGDGVVHRENY
ncbi:hypothetical protein ACMDCR_29785 [Labrys okinawensis]|uniref:hypothetical protein n=1 Tax=Labrys okinawensis TaxID=346911 RepID=UPI0039BC8B0C